MALFVLGGFLKMKKYAEKFYHSRKWQKARTAYIFERQSIDGGVCERCKRELGYIVHHKKRITPENISDIDITLNPENFEYLCKLCHDREHEEEIYGKRRGLVCTFDVNGQPLEVSGRMGDD